MFESSDFGSSASASQATQGIADSNEDRHPLAHIRSLVDDLCEDGGTALAQHAPLIRAALLQALYSFTTDDQLLEQLRYNALYRWFVGLRREQLIWREADYAQALNALRNGPATAPLFRRAAKEAHAYAALAPRRFRIDTSLIEAWIRPPAAAVASIADGVRSDAARTSRLDRARSAILRRISDPTLDADAVAAELHMSRRALYLLFERYGLTPTRAIRDIRLECCLRLLRDEQQCHRKIADIAMDHGFKHFASFSRQFKMRYGMPPSSVSPTVSRSAAA